MAQLAAFTTNNLTAQAIVRAADREAGNPGLYLTDAGSEAITAPAYVKLQAILDHEALTGDWSFRADATSLAVTAGTRTVSLPSDYWASRFNTFWWIDATTGHRSPLRLYDREAFHDEILPSGDGHGTPYAVCVVKNQGAAEGGSASGVLMLNPVNQSAGLVEVHYAPLADPLAAISEKPWLPHGLFLIKRLVAELLSDQDDQRAVIAFQVADRLKREIRQSAADPGQKAKRFPLSPDRFVPPVRI